MKLFVWNEPYHVNYGASCLYVLADDEEAARKIAAERTVRAGFGGASDDTFGLKDLGAPTRVIEGPYAECYHWEE